MPCRPSCSPANQPQERKDYAAKLKAAGNKAYGSKDYNRAIDLYGQALLCKQDPVFYSNRAACWNAMSEWNNVIEDTTAAINLDNEYVKALNRRANAYEQVDRNSEALLDYTASCIIDGFRNESSAQSVERLLKKVAEVRACPSVSRATNGLTHNRQRARLFWPRRRRSSPAPRLLPTISRASARSPRRTALTMMPSSMRTVARASSERDSAP